MDLFGLQIEHAGDGGRFGRDELAGIMDDEVVALPDDCRGMWLDRIVVVARCPIDVIDLVRRSLQRRIGIADLVEQWLSHEGRLRQTGCLGLCERGGRRLGCVGNLDQRRRMIRLLLRPGEHHGNRLAIPMDAVVLHDRKIAGPGCCR